MEYQVIGSVDDTLVDLIMDTLGSEFAAIVSLWALLQKIKGKAKKLPN